ncbi:MAG: cation:proton antiporter, partial [bacterium]
YDPNSGETSTWNLDFTSIAYMCSILTGSDIIAAVTLIKFDDQPKLFSIILGEGLFNDVVVIILYQTMKKISEDPNKDNISPYKTPLIAIYDFLLLTVVSLAIGIFCGFSATLMTK